MPTASLYFLNRQLKNAYERKEARFAELRSLRKRTNEAYDRKGRALGRLILAYRQFDKIVVHEAIGDLHDLIVEDKLAVKTFRAKRDQAYADYRKGDAQYYQERIKQLKDRIEELYAQIAQLKALGPAQIREMGKNAWCEDDLSPQLEQAKQEVVMRHQEFHLARMDFHELKVQRDQKQVEYDAALADFMAAKQNYRQTKAAQEEQELAMLILPVESIGEPQPEPTRPRFRLFTAPSRRLFNRPQT